jgi:hypothetical protein
LSTISSITIDYYRLSHSKIPKKVNNSVAARAVTCLFKGSVIYLGVDMANKKSKKKTTKSNSKGSKSQRKEEQFAAYARSKASALQNGEGR